MGTHNAGVSVRVGGLISASGMPRTGANSGIPRERKDHSIHRSV